MCLCNKERAKRFQNFIPLKALATIDGFELWVGPATNQVLCAKLIFRDVNRLKLMHNCLFIWIFYCQHFRLMSAFVIALLCVCLLLHFSLTFSKKKKKKFLSGERLCAKQFLLNSQHNAAGNPLSDFQSSTFAGCLAWLQSAAHDGMGVNILFSAQEINSVSCDKISA